MQQLPRSFTTRESYENYINNLPTHSSDAETYKSDYLCVRTTPKPNEVGKNSEVPSLEVADDIPLLIL